MGRGLSAEFGPKCELLSIPEEDRTGAKSTWVRLLAELFWLLELLMRWARAPELALALAYLSIPVFVLIGVVQHRAGMACNRCRHDLSGLVCRLLPVDACEKPHSGIAGVGSVFGSLSTIPR